MKEISIVICREATLLTLTAAFTWTSTWEFSGLEMVTEKITLEL